MTEIEQKLENLSFVQWDRFVETSKEIYFYGWIKREKDCYKDFLVVVFNKTDNKFWYLTSSVGYDLQIDKILDIPSKNRVICKRIEDNFIIKNSIKLNAPE